MFSVFCIVYSIVFLSSFSNENPNNTPQTVWTEHSQNNMNQNDLASGICLLDGKYRYIPSSSYNSQSNEGKMVNSFQFFFFYFAASVTVARRDSSPGFFNFTNMRNFAKKCFREKGKDVKDFGREKLMRLGIIKNPSIFGSTIVDIVKLDGKEEKVPEFLQFTLRKY